MGRLNQIVGLPIFVGTVRMNGKQQGTVLLKVSANDHIQSVLKLENDPIMGESFILL